MADWLAPPPGFADIYYNGPGLDPARWIVPEAGLTPVKFGCP